MEKELMRVALRQKAMYLPDVKPSATLSESTAALIGNLRKIGFTMTERLLHAFNGMSYEEQCKVVDVMNEIMGTKLNWAPLVKGWLTPTGETQQDKVFAAIVNAFDIKDVETVTMPCGHKIPTGVFHIERYNGCPLCGQQFRTSHFVYRGQGCKLKELDLWTDVDMVKHLNSLLASPTPLDATQADSLKTLLNHYGLPKDANVVCKETTMLAIDTLVKESKGREAQPLLKTPVDVMRYLWYVKTGLLQIVEPSTLIANARRNGRHITFFEDHSISSAIEMREKLRLHYDRYWCRVVAEWMNGLPMTAQQACEAMHPKREMWVRFIRALRLAEYSHKKGFENLAVILDCFYNEKYDVFNGKVETARLKKDSTTTFTLLKKRPGLFARSLFANMLWFGSDDTLAAFRKVADKVPLRLLFTLSMYADDYFNPEGTRVVSPLGGSRKSIPTNPLVKKYSETELGAMIDGIKSLVKDSMYRRYQTCDDLKDKSVWIDSQLYTIPLSIGERSKTIQDASCALPGTVFPVDGDEVRLFLQWGKGLPAQHLDMDLSCVFIAPNDTYECAYYDLNVIGAKHSGDIRRIPDMVGTAEYIELDIAALRKYGVRYAVFTCNAYTAGKLAPNLVVGWMNTKEKMKVSEKTGVAYDPSTVQHMVRVDDSNLSKGLVFGVLRVETHDILWLEMPFGGQIARNMDFKTLSTLMQKLQSRITIGQALELKAKAENATLSNKEDADTMFDYSWALDTAKVSQYLLD